MTVKEKVVRESISIINVRLKKIEDVLNSNPLVEIIELRREAQKLLNETKEIGSGYSKDFTRKIHLLSLKEKKLLAMARKRQDSLKLIEEKVNLEMELSDLTSELYWIEQRKIK